MKYVSTRGEAPVLGFADVLLTGLARDGGLYVPDEWPALPVIDAHRPYADVAAAVMAPYVDGALEFDEFHALVAEAYASFDEPDVCSVVELGDGLWLLELFHGPTLAFKDMALQLVGRLFDYELARRGERATIVVATSGDTGSAAIEACVGRARVAIVVLHPAGRVSEVQRRQMTTGDAPNVHNVAVEGTFDDCQDLVKAMFADEHFREETALSAMNSINWARVMAQIPYYVWAAGRIGRCAFGVPTGNFGNVLAGWVAARTGLPVAQLVVGSNRNDILARWLDTGVLEARDVVPTLSPSMDIQISSNLERLLFERLGRDGAAVRELMAAFRATGRAEAPSDPIFTGASFDDGATLAEIARVYRDTGRLIDPHTAVGVAAARARRDSLDPIVCLATAHPAKFPDAVEQATGVRPALPNRLADLLERPERYETVPNDLATLKSFILAVVRPS
ncbi:MAG: threonine synthase [Acidimicrobiales bacterium]